MKKFVSALSIVLCLCIFTGCSLSGTQSRQQYTATFLTLFDTITTVVGRADSQADFHALAQPIREELEYYHRLFDIYNEYEGINNLKTVNDHAGKEPVVVDPALLALLQDCKDYSAATGGACNAALGSVLTLWHEAREAGINDPASASLPDPQALKAASLHTDPDDIILDLEASTVFLADPLLRLDVGAIAKGWAVQRVCENAPAGLLVSVGGNVYATGPKTPEGTPWSVGIQNPDHSDRYLHTLKIQSGAVVTSGNYQRAYMVDGQMYHHIIDPDTLYPSEFWASITVICPDSGLADMLSTTLFVLEQEAGQALLEQYDAHAMWVDPVGNRFYSPGFQAFIQN